MTHYRWPDIEKETSVQGGGKRRVTGVGASLVRVEIAAGSVADRHSHSFEQFVHILEGRGTLTTENGDQAFAAGSVFHLPAAWHAARFDEDTVLVETNLGG